METLPQTVLRDQLWSVGKAFARKWGKETKRRWAWHNPEFGQRVSDFYMAQPVEPAPYSKQRYATMARYHTLTQQIVEQFQAIEELGVQVSFVDEDPYNDYRELAHDLDHHRMKVLRTATTGPHPFWSDRQNDLFRVVHDVFGHYRNNVPFTRDGEDAAYRGHSEMMSDYVLPVMVNETRGQNSALIYGAPKHEFKEQKLFLAPQWMWETYSYNFEF